MDSALLMKSWWGASSMPVWSACMVEGTIAIALRNRRI